MALEERVQAIEARNRKVESDKAWETSWTRKVSIMAITYVIAGLVMKLVIGAPDWYLGALIPVLGYLLSTAGLPLIRAAWEKRQ